MDSARYVLDDQPLGELGHVGFVDFGEHAKRRVSLGVELDPKILAFEGHAIDQEERSRDAPRPKVGALVWKGPSGGRQGTGCAGRTFTADLRVMGPTS